MLRIRKCLLVLIIALAIPMLTSIRYVNATSASGDQNRPANTTESCVCGGCLSTLWPMSDKTQGYYLQKWRAEDDAYNAKWGFYYE